MAHVVSKTNPTAGVVRSVNTPNFPMNNWWINPSLPASPPRYWKNDGGTLAEMTQGEKDTADQNMLASRSVTLQSRIKNKLFYKDNTIKIQSNASGLTITTTVVLLIQSDAYVVIPDGSDKKYILQCLVYNKSSDNFSIKEFEKTTGEYEDFTSDEFLVKRIKEWSVEASGATLTEEQSFL